MLEHQTFVISTSLWHLAEPVRQQEIPGWYILIAPKPKQLHISQLRKVSGVERQHAFPMKSSEIWKYVLKEK